MQKSPPLTTVCSSWGFACGELVAASWVSVTCLDFLLWESTLTAWSEGGMIEGGGGTFGMLGLKRHPHVTGSMALGHHGALSVYPLFPISRCDYAYIHQSVSPSSEAKPMGPSNLVKLLPNKLS